MTQENAIRKGALALILLALAAIALVVLFAGCDSDVSPTEPDADAADTELELTYSVGEYVEDSVFTRAQAASLEPSNSSILQLSSSAEVETSTFMGMTVKASFTEDKPEAAADAPTRATVYNTVDLEGATVYAFVFDPETNKTVAARQTLTVTNGKLTVKGRRGCKILFYTGGAPYASVGDDLSTVTTSQNYRSDPMQCISETITTLNEPLGTLRFKHVFSKLRVVLKTSDGTPVNAFSVTTQEKLSYTNATVNVFDRSYTTSGAASTKSFTVSDNMSDVAAADYQVIINSSETPIDLTLVFATEGRGATIDGVKNWLTSVNNTLTLKSRQFLPGHRYSINITVSPANSDVYMNSALRADRNYYQWDAYEPVGTGDELTWSPGNSGCHLRSYSSADFNNGVVSQCAKDCPSYTEMQMYLGAGVLIDDGHTGAYQQAYIFTDPDTGEKTCYHAGAWLKKKQYIAGFDDGTATKATRSTTKGRPTAETVDQYFFLPLYGFHDVTNYENASASTYHRRIQYAGQTGYYQGRTVSKIGLVGKSAWFHVMKVDATSASATTLNWSSNNLCGTPIWSVD